MKALLLAIFIVAGKCYGVSSTLSACDLVGEIIVIDCYNARHPTITSLVWRLSFGDADSDKLHLNII